MVAIGDIERFDRLAFRRDMIVSLLGPVKILTGRGPNLSHDVFGRGVFRRGGDADMFDLLANAADRQHRDADDDDDDHHHWRECEEDRIDSLGFIVLFHDELQPVRQWLAEPEHVHVFEERDDPKAEPDAVGADAVLNPGSGFPLEQNQVGHHAQDAEVGDQRDPDPGGEIEDPVNDGFNVDVHSSSRAVARMSV